MCPFQGTGEQLFVCVCVCAGVPGTWGHLLQHSLQLAHFKSVERTPLCSPPALQRLTREQLPGLVLLQGLLGDTQKLPRVFCRKAEGPSAV